MPRAGIHIRFVPWYVGDFVAAALLAVFVAVPEATFATGSGAGRDGARTGSGAGRGGASAGSAAGGATTDGRDTGWVVSGRGPSGAAAAEDATWVRSIAVGLDADDAGRPASIAPAVGALAPSARTATTAETRRDR
jgi:hypothetical protein